MCEKGKERQQKHIQQKNAHGAFQRELRQTLEIAKNQPQADYNQAQRQNIATPAKELQHDPQPAAHNSAVAGCEHPKEGQRANRSHDHPGDIEFAIQG